MVKAQEWLESQEEYNTREKREQIKELNISKEKLEGELDLSDFIDLKKLNCSENKLTSLNLSNCFHLEKISCYGNLLTNLTLPTNQTVYQSYQDFVPTNLKRLYLYNNNFTSDLSFLFPATNLERLKLGNYNKEKIKQGIYNNFTGSLDYLSEMEKLKELWIDNTDINEVNTELLIFH